ncbi:YraN family protein [Rubrobacter indicoceani]|uniref:YraN family protein n=1 Tax=Rubrobacter indicoceani TaxID=2051957 RepID=UPI000E5C335C|nr:YraN family protein [Rubrobacter indicoceani]
MNNRRTGDRGEALALRYLERLGYKLVGRNYRTRYGEIDLIVRDGRTLVFVEVKFRRGVGYGDPLEAVTPRKQRVIRAVAEVYLSELEAEPEDLRFDVIGITAGERRSVRHVRDAF